MAGYPTTDTFDSLIDEVITSLQGFGASADLIQTLSGNLSQNGLTFTVASAVPTLGRGIVEIDQELIYVNSFSGTTATIAPWGRGWKGTTPAIHNDGAAIYVSPQYPRSIVAREVNNTIRAVYPSLFPVGTTDITVNSRDWQYQLPAECDNVITVEWKFSVVTSWQPMNGWEQVSSANTTDFATGNFLAVSDPLPSDSILHVTYMKPPTLLVNGSDGFAVTTGLPSSCRDVIVYGAASRLLPWIDATHVMQESVPSDAQDQVRPPGTAINVGRELRSLYNMRLQQERAQLMARYPARVHKIRTA